VEAARKKGLKKIAITDHGFKHIGIGTAVSDLGKIREEITRLNQRFSDIEILMGIEANLIGMDGEIDIPQKHLNAFDIILMGFHKAVIPASFQDAWVLFARNALGKLGLVDRNTIRKANTQALICAINRYPIRSFQIKDFIGITGIPHNSQTFKQIIKKTASPNIHNHGDSFYFPFGLVT
jgi:putative hydrolase